MGSIAYNDILERAVRTFIVRHGVRVLYTVEAAGRRRGIIGI